MPKPWHKKKIQVFDTHYGSDEIPEHRVWSVSYLPSWQLIRLDLSFKDPTKIQASLARVKEYIDLSPEKDRVFRLFRVTNLMNALPVYHFAEKKGSDAFPKQSRDYLIEYREYVKKEYRKLGPVLAWDWVVTWSEVELLAIGDFKLLDRVYHSLRTTRKRRPEPKVELAYFMSILETVALSLKLDFERSHHVQQAIESSPKAAIEEGPEELQSYRNPFG